MSHSGVIIYHNPQCSTSRKALELIREAGIEPVIVDYRQVGWTKDLLKSLFGSMKLKPRDLLRVNGTPAEELGLTDPAVSDGRLLTAMTRHPTLVQRPIVVTPKGTLLARPPPSLLVFATFGTNSMAGQVHHMSKTALYSAKTPLFGVKGAEKQGAGLLMISLFF